MRCIPGAVTGLCNLDCQESGLQLCLAYRPQAASRKQPPSIQTPLWTNTLNYSHQLPTFPVAGSFWDWLLRSAARITKGTNFGFIRMAHMMRHLPKCAEILSFTLPGLIYSWWGETQCNLCVISCTSLHHARESKNLKKLMQSDAGETENNQPTSG